MWNSSARKICPFIPLYLFIHSSIYISVDSWMFYTLHYNPILLLFILFQLWELFQVGAHVRLTWAPILVWGFLGLSLSGFVFKHFPVFYKMLRAHPVFSPPQPQNQPFLPGALQRPFTNTYSWFAPWGLHSGRSRWRNPIHKKLPITPKLGQLQRTHLTSPPISQTGKVRLRGGLPQGTRQWRRASGI